MRGEELIEPWNMAVLLVCGVLGVYLALGFLHGWLIRGQQGLQAAPHAQHWCAAASLPQSAPAPHIPNSARLGVQDGAVGSGPGRSSVQRLCHCRRAAATCRLRAGAGWGVGWEAEKQREKEGQGLEERAAVTGSVWSHILNRVDVLLLLL